jgi:hypothetical protein
MTDSRPSRRQRPYAGSQLNGFLLALRDVQKAWDYSAATLLQRLAMNEREKSRFTGYWLASAVFTVMRERYRQRLLAGHSPEEPRGKTCASCS